MYIHVLFVNLDMEKKPFKGPDLHAPRKRTKTKKIITYPQKDPDGFFAATKKQYPSLAEFTNQQLAGIMKVITNILADEVVTNRHGVKLPGGLGAVVTGTYKPTEKTADYNIDFKTSKELGIQVHYMNWHTYGYMAKIYYTASTYGCKLKSYRVTFKPCRKLQREIAAVMKTDGGFKRYYPSSSTWPITYSFRKRDPLKRTWRQKKAEKEEKKRLEEYRKFLEDYDEFRFD